MYTVQNFAFQCFIGCRNHGDGFVIVCIERLFLCFYHLNAVLSQYRHEFVVDKFNAFFYGGYVGGCFHVFEGAFKVIHDGENTADTLFTTVQDKFCLLLHGAFAVIVKLGRQAQVFVLLLFNLFIGLFQFLGELFFFCQGSFVFL